MPSAGLLVSVVVPTNNRALRLRELLDSLQEQTIPADRFEVLVVDNGSEDSTPGLLEQKRATGELQLSVIRRAGDSGGPSAPRNEGWRAARASVISFIDDDCVATPGWLAAGLRACHEHPGAFVQGRTEPNPAEIDRLGPFSRTLEMDQLGPYYQTANIFYPRSLLERLDGFDEAAHARSGSGEDTDLAYRAIELGATPVFARDALVRHAVNDLGPVGKLRVAARWGDSMRVYARFPALRARVFTRRIFWKYSHYLLFGALLAVVLVTLLPARLRPLGLLPARAYVRHVWHRNRGHRAAVPLMAYELLHDVVEVAAVARGGARHRLVVL